jgi:hypothetical protein
MKIFRILLALLLIAPALAFGQAQVITQGVYSATPPSLVSGQPTILQTDSAGNLKVFVFDNWSITQTIVTCSTTSGLLITANPYRRYLLIQQTGANDVTITPGSATAVAAAGLILQASGVGKQGAAQEFPHGAPSNQFQCITGSGSSAVTVWEGQ